MASPHENMVHENPGILADPHFWLSISFIIFIFILWKAGKKALETALDGRIDKIRQDITSAENLRVESQELLAQYERKHRDAIQEAEEVIAKAEKHAAKIKKDADSDLQEIMQRREKQLQERLDRMKHNAISEIQQYAADIAIQATTEIISTTLDKDTNMKLVDQSIKDLGKNLH